MGLGRETRAGDECVTIPPTTMKSKDSDTSAVVRLIFIARTNSERKLVIFIEERYNQIMNLIDVRTKEKPTFRMRRANELCEGGKGGERGSRTKIYIPFVNQTATTQSAMQ